jgi:3-oxoadipate enol-lactonase
MNELIEIRPNRFIHVAIHQNPTSAATVFFIHGLGGRGEQWQQQVELLKSKYTLIVPDLLGHGESAKPEPSYDNPYYFTAFSQDVEALFQRYSTEKNIVLGHSYGGGLAVKLAFDHQDKINKLILFAPINCAPSFQLPFIYRLPEIFLILFRRVLEIKFFQDALDPSASPQLKQKEIMAGRTNPMYVIKGMVNGMRDIPTFDIKKLKIPTLIFLGVSDRIIPNSVTEQFYQGLPQHTFVQIHMASHLMMQERPDEVNQRILTFLGDVE